ncbi:MAG: N-acetylmuramoyl-L-alanine amidase [Methylobacteriaceae bacterium]|nr:N-acetylmuramoyl-L-alanine amidase [Methylobacteriaceae bacterium]
MGLGRFRISGLIGLALAASVLFARPPAQATGLVGARLAARDIAAGVAVTAATVERSATTAKFIFDLNRPLAVEAYVLADPDRVVVELPETSFLIDPAVGRDLPTHRKGEPAALVSGFRFGQFARGRSRIVFDLAGPARIVKALAESTESGGAARLVIELAHAQPDAFRAAARAARAAQLQKAPAREEPPAQANPPVKPLVVIDAGHGGVDMGAVGAKSSYEKDVVLDVARRLAARLEAGGRMRTLLTRDADEFIPLADRVKIARKASAALFVSIHADMLNETSVHGATVYTVSDRASDAEAARVAAAENAADKAGGMAESEEIGDVNDILFDLTRRETRAIGHQFAVSLIDFWKAAGDLNKNPIRSAGFVVLKAPDVPSVLLELGYMSNERDLAKLNSEEWRQTAANRVAQSIERYFARRTAGAEAPALERSAGLAIAR